MGSFVNVLLYRLPREENFVSSRSRCPSCYYQLRWFDLVPLASFILLGGACRSCKQAISYNYPLIELFAGFLSLAVFIVFREDPWHVLFWLIVVNLFLILFLFDLKYFILPDLILIWLGIYTVAYYSAYWFFNKNWLVVSWQSSLAGAIAIALFFGAIWFFSKGRWLGLGDVKLGFIIGLIFGVIGGGLVLYLAIMIGGLISVILLTFGKATLKTKLPLGSFITIASVTYIFFQESINIFINNLIL